MLFIKTNKYFLKFFTCRIAIGGVVAGGMGRSLLRGARQPFPQVFADLSFWGCASLLR